MTTQELIAKLSEFDPDTPVLVSHDEEGNGFKHAYRMSTAFIDPNSPQGYYDYLNTYHETEELDASLVKLRQPLKLKRCVIIWP